MIELLEFIGEFLSILGIVIFTLTTVFGLGLIAFVGVSEAFKLFKRK